MQNLAEALDQVFSAHGTALKAVSDARAAQHRARRLATYAHVWTLHRQGWSNRSMAQYLGLGRLTVVRYLQATPFPKHNERSDTGKSPLTPCQTRLLKRWNAGCQEAIQRFRDLQYHGYIGSYVTVAPHRLAHSPAPHLGGGDRIGAGRCGDHARTPT